MALNIQKKSRTRNPKRERAFATMSVTWDAYDALDKVATENGGSLSETIKALVEFYNARGVK